MVLTCRVVRLESFGAFLDIGCGVVAMLPIEHISVSRIHHSNQRFQEGQKILAAVYRIDPENRRITMSHRELLGTWMENASRFQPGGDGYAALSAASSLMVASLSSRPTSPALRTAARTWRSVTRYRVFIKNIRPERMKVKLQVIEKLPLTESIPPLAYQITDGKLDRWTYSPPGCEKVVETVFTAP